MPLRRSGEKCRVDGDPRFWCVTCYFNSKGDKNRRRNYERFAANLKLQRVNLFTVELCASEAAEGLPPTASTAYARFNHPDVLWSKEALLNIGIAKLPPACEYVCWIDADVIFPDNRWAAKCIAALQTHPVVQPFDRSVFLGDGEPLPRTASSVDAGRLLHSFAGAFQGRKRLDYRLHHPGLAWAARRGVLEATDGLYAKNIMSLAEVMMGYAFTCPTPATVPVLWNPRTAPPDLTTNTRSWSAALCHDIQRWQHRAAAHVGGKLGAPVGVTAYHLWHGSGQSRNYQEANAIIAEYDPDKHVRLTDAGLLVWSAAAPAALKRKVDAYFGHRNSSRA